MKKLIVIAALVLTSSTVLAADSCTLTVFKKKVDAKTAYLASGEKLSGRMIKKLSTACTIKSELMSADQVKRMKIADLKKKLAKLQK